MESTNNFTREYIDNCRIKIDTQIKSYNYLIAAARDEYTTNELLDKAITSFEPVFFNNLLLVLYSYFNQQGKSTLQQDGNLLNEVELLCHSIMHNNNKMISDSSNSRDYQNAVIDCKPGEEIKLNETDFIKLLNTFLNEIESKYVQMQ